MKKWIKRLAAGVVILLALGLIGGAVYQAIAQSRDLARFPAPGLLVDVDGARMHIHCRGQGSPTAVLEQGLNGVAAAWDELHRELAAVSRVCAYDRAGLGYSEPIDHPTRAPDVAERLAQLLAGAGIDDELILVGWSAGGVYARAFQRRYPDRVAAMLLIDSSQEQQGRRYPTPPDGGNAASLLKLARYLAPVGLVRLSGMVEGRFASFRGPDELRRRLIALYEQTHVVGTMLRESEAFDRDIAGDAPTSLGDLPLIVLSEGRPVEIADTASPEERAYRLERREVGEQLQRELASLSTPGPAGDRDRKRSRDLRRPAGAGDRFAARAGADRARRGGGGAGRRLSALGPISLAGSGPSPSRAQHAAPLRLPC